MLDSLTMRFTVGSLGHVVLAQRAEELETEISHVGSQLCLYDETPIKTLHTKGGGEHPWLANTLCMLSHIDAGKVTLSPVLGE